MKATSKNTENQHLHRIAKRQAVSKATTKPKRQLRRFRDFVKRQVIAEEVDEVQIRGAGFISVNGTMAFAEREKVIKAFAKEVGEMARNGKQVVVTAIAYD